MTDARAQETGVAADTLEHGAGKSVNDACAKFLAKRGGGPVSFFNRNRKLPSKDAAAGQPGRGRATPNPDARTTTHH